jgi:LacI family transcriptional regulator
MATIKDVAKLAGVSVSAVSRVMNGYTDIGEKTKERIFKAIEELDYVPNSVAKKLSQKYSKTIGLLLANFEASDGKDCVLYQIMKGAYKAGQDTGYEIISITGDSTSQAKNNFDKFCNEHKLAGVIIQGLNSTDPYFEQIKNSKFSSVGIDMNEPTNRFGCIGVDNEKASSDAVDLLISKAYRNIGIYTGKESEVVCKQRLSGYKTSLKKHGIDFNSDYVLDCAFSEKVAYEKTADFLAKNKKLDAVFCVSDLMAIGLLRYCEENGIKVPEDLGIIGFDDIPLCTYTRPRLSTVHQDMNKAGYDAVLELLSMIKDKKYGKKIILEHKIIERDSA